MVSSFYGVNCENGVDTERIAYNAAVSISTTTSKRCLRTVDNWIKMENKYNKEEGGMWRSDILCWEVNDMLEKE